LPHSRSLSIASIVLAATLVSLGPSAPNPQLAQTELEARAQRALQVINRMGMSPHPNTQGGIARSGNMIELNFYDRAVETPCPSMACVYVHFYLQIYSSESAARSRWDAHNPSDYVTEDISAGSFKAEYYSAPSRPCQRGYVQALCGSMYLNAGLASDSAKNVPSEKALQDYYCGIVPSWNQKLKSLMSRLVADLAAEGLCSAALPPPSGGRPPTPPPDAGSRKPPETKPGSPCDRYEEALAKVRCQEWHLQTLRQMRADMESARIALLKIMYGSDAIDVGFLGAGLSRAAVTRFLESWGITTFDAALKQTVLTSIMTAVLKGILKEGMKMVLETATAKGVDMSRLLAAGTDSGGRKILAEIMKNQLAADGTARMLGYGASSGGPLPGPILQMVNNEYVAPTVDAGFFMLDVLRTINTLQGQIDQCNALRDGIKNFDDRVLAPRELQLDRAKQDLDVAKAACDQWRKDNPARRLP